MKNRTKASLFGLLTALSLTITACVPAAQSGPVNVTLLAVNDIHGNLLPSTFNYPDPADRSKRISLQAGGVEAIATVVKETKAKNPNTLLVGAGDLISASPLVSSLLADEPTLKALSDIGMSFSSVGNHEFDRGYKELLRLQNGGCAEPFDPAKACKFGNYEGAKFQYLAANVIVKDTGKTAFPAYVIKEVGGVKIAFIGLVLKETPTIVLPSGVAGLEFTDEAEAANKLVPELKAQGAQVIIVMIHQGGVAKDPFYVKDCGTLSGSIVDITKKLDKAVDMVISGHTHQGYQCRVDGRLVTQSDFYGHLMMQIDLVYDRSAGKLLSINSNPIIMDASKIAKDPAMTEIVNKAKALTDTLTNQPIAKLGAEQITREQNAAGESSLGDVIADSQLFATKDPAKGGAVVAFMNPGGIRANLPPNPSINSQQSAATVTYGDTFTVQPFGNSLVVMTLTGAQIKTLLEQQFDNPAPGQNRILQVSEGFTYTWDAKAAKGSKVSNIALNGTPIDPAKTYRVTVNSFLADGGDNFLVLKEGTERLGGDLDLDAIQAYLKAMESAGKPVGVTPRNRITVVNQ
ncbi:MAG: bifunctional metallophosphatase/5'-nucleotidase [Meiothermus sp.]|mgnify:CR=1 FL=1